MHANALAAATLSRIRHALVPSVIVLSISAAAAAAPKAVVVTDIGEGARVSYSYTVAGLFDATAGTAYCTFPPVPAGKRLVVEYVSVKTVQANGSNPAPIVLDIAFGGTSEKATLPLGTLEVGPANTIVLTTASLRIYYEAGETPFVVPTSVSANAIRCSLSGYEIATQ